MIAGITSTQILGNIQSRLLQLRTALEAAQDLYAWTSAQSQADLENAGFSPADAQTILSAVADANALAQLYTAGTLPGGYALPYTFGASQRQVIGPQ